MFKKKTLPMGMLTMVLIIGVALAGVGYALWSETLYIGGSVQTGEVDVEFSEKNSYECIDVDEFGECVLETDEQLILEYGDKSQAANCYVEWGGPDNESNKDDGSDRVQVTVTGMYPSWHCKVEFKVKSTGTVPVHVKPPVANGDIPDWVATNIEDCYTDDIQLHNGDETDLCTMDIHFTNDQAPPEDSGPYTFGWTITAHQWNEEPTGDPQITASGDGFPDSDGILYTKGFADRYRSFGNTGGGENYLGVGDVGATSPAEIDFIWPSNNWVQFIYDQAGDKLISNVDLDNDGTIDETLEYPDLTSSLAGLANGCTVDEVDFMILQLAARDAGTTVDFKNVSLNGFSLGDFSATGDLYYWIIEGVDFSQSFTMVGNLQLTGTFSDSQERGKLEMLVACAP